MLQIGRRADLSRRGGGQVPSVADLMNAQLSHLKNIGQNYYVDATNGNDSATGKSWKNAFKTITKAVATAAAGSTIFLIGTFAEAVTVSVDNISIIGCGRGIRAARWNATAATNDVKNLTISAAHCTVENVYFVPGPKSSTYSACIVLDTDAQWARIERCRFQGAATAYYAIHSPTVGADNVHIIDCEFYYFNTATNGSAIYGVSTGGYAYSGWVIDGCTFQSCVRAILFNGKCCQITNNNICDFGLQSAAAGGAIAAICTTKIDLRSTSGGGGGANIVTNNFLGGTYSNAQGYYANADVSGADMWLGNYIEGGLTTALPS